MPNAIGQPWFKAVRRPLRARRFRTFEPTAPTQASNIRRIDVPSAWSGLDHLLPGILERFDVGSATCLEFGVEFGYSTVALSAYFDEVIGVDLFTGDDNTEHHGDHFATTSARLAEFRNIKLVRSDYRDWIARDNQTYDLIHIDIVHTYEDTYRSGLWAARHAPCVLFHDTVSFFSVRAAVIDIAAETRRLVFEWPLNNGLGILI